MTYEYSYNYSFHPSSNLREGTRIHPRDYEKIEGYWTVDDMNDASRSGTRDFKTLERFANFHAQFYSDRTEAEKDRRRMVELGIRLRDQKDVDEFGALKAHATTKAIDRFVRMREEFEAKYPQALRLAKGFKEKR